VQRDFARGTKEGGEGIRTQKDREERGGNNVPGADRLGVLVEELRIHLVHGGEVGHVGQEDLDLHAVIDARAGGVQHRAEVLQSLSLWRFSDPLACVPLSRRFFFCFGAWCWG